MKINLISVRLGRKIFFVIFFLCGKENNKKCETDGGNQVTFDRSKNSFFFRIIFQKTETWTLSEKCDVTTQRETEIFALWLHVFSFLKKLKLALVTLFVGSFCFRVWFIQSLGWKPDFVFGRMEIIFFKINFIYWIKISLFSHFPHLSPSISNSFTTKNQPSIISIISHFPTFLPTTIPSFPIGP